jgi:tripartite-type tricarboxylate transporter receptor subunit TctC
MRLLFGVFLAVLTMVGTGWADDWPNRPIKLIVPYAAGGSGDIVARELAQKLSKSLGQAVVIEDRAGASGNIGTADVANSPPDGYTLLLGSDIQFAINPNFWPNLPYHVNDFAPVSLVAFVDLVLNTNPSLGVTNLHELIVKAKQKPGAITYGSTGPGSTHELAIELLQQLGDFKLTEVPYRGSAQAIPDLLSGQVQMMLMGVPQSLPYLRSDKLQPLGVGSPKRLATLPQIPTIAEQGFPHFEANNYWCLYAPAGTDGGIIKKLQESVAHAVEEPDLRDQFLATGLTPVGSRPDALAARVQADSVKWSKVITALRSQPQK